MQIPTEATILAMTTQAGVILLLFAVPILVICTALILRCTRRFSEEAEAVVKSAEESHIAAFLESNGPAIIRRLGDGRQAKLPGNPQSQISLIEGEDVIEVHEVPEEEGDEYGRQGIDEELRTVIRMEPASKPPEPDENQKENGSGEPDPESQFKPLE